MQKVFNYFEQIFLQIRFFLLILNCSLLILIIKCKKVKCTNKNDRFCANKKALLFIKLILANST